MSGAEKNTKSNKNKKVSVWNWMGTIILMGIPGVNIIASILFIIFAKAQAKRSFCIAWLILAVVAFVLICAAFLFLPELMTAISEGLRTAAAATPAVSLP